MIWTLRWIYCDGLLIEAVKIHPFIIIVLLLFFVEPKFASAQPKIDGSIGTGEWDDGETIQIELNSGDFVDLTVMYTQSHVYYLAVINHDDPGDEIILDPDIPHDYFGIEFDINKDEAIMGTTASPDDTILVNYENTGASDMYMYDYKAFYDVDNGGVSDVTGIAGTDGENLIYEIKRPLITHDLLGYDINLNPGQSYQIMIGIWDDQPPHSAAAYFNKRIDNFQFIQLVVADEKKTFVGELIGGSILFVSLIIGILVVKRGISLDLPPL